MSRLGTDYIDLYELPVWSIPADRAEEVFSTLYNLRAKVQIRAYGWSTGETDNAQLLATRTNGATILHPLNVLSDAPDLLDVGAQHDLANICSGPLAMGFLSGKFDRASVLPADDVRGSGHDWVEYFRDGRPRP